MYTASHPVSTAMNGMGADMIDGSGTINPAALNTPVSVLPTPTSTTAPSSSPRGVKRSRSPDIYGDLPPGSQGDDGMCTPATWSTAGSEGHHHNQKPRKRGRPPKPHGGGLPDSPLLQPPHQTPHALPPQLQTPQIQTQSLPQQPNITPTQSSPPKGTPTKAVVKALPTVRDHTTDQLSPEGDEYVPREYDEAGEKKVSPTGRALGGREYKCRTFLVPNRGDKLFMLATECARVLGYRDSYLLFNKNRSLYKIIATQPEKDDLIHQEILPYSYRSRQIAIVTAKSMFRQFGSRVINNGRRVRDDYWEAKARKQGFTEEDLAGEKRPGGAKAAREAQAAEAATAAALGHHQNVVYSNVAAPGDNHSHPQPLQPDFAGPMVPGVGQLPMITTHFRDYGNIPRPRQEVTGTPYQDRIQPSSTTEIMSQANQSAEFSKALNQQSAQRGRYLDNHWSQERRISVSSPLQQGSETSPPISQPLQSPQLVSSNMINTGQQPMHPHQGSQIINSSAYSQQPHQQNHLAQSPIRAAHQPMRPDQVQHRPSNLSYSSTNVQQGSPYGYPQPSPIWGQPPPQPQQSPVAAAHTGMPQYPQQQHHSSQSPHPSQSPQQHAPHPQLQHTQSSGSMHGAGMGYQGMPIAQTGYGGMGGIGRNVVYPQPNPSSHTYLQGQTTAGTAAGLQGWAPPPGQGNPGQQQWSGY
ncbi:hypothetical protein MMC34_003775 [Xylographa carneopallida]|nr:hypothetical protein [Xylographa carneopallida]